MSLFDRLRDLFKDLQEPKNNEEPFKIYTTTMVNTLTLSSDMETLYLIDNGRAIAFPLNSKDGILIGTLKGQITVATGFKLPETDTNTEVATNGSDLTKKRTLKLLVKDNSQWTGAYNRTHGIMAFIGATEIDLGITNQDQVKSQAFVFDLKTKVINIRRNKNAIEIAELDR